MTAKSGNIATSCHILTCSWQRPAGNTPCEIETIPSIQANPVEIDEEEEEEARRNGMAASWLLWHGGKYHTSCLSAEVKREGGGEEGGK